jgi:predicted HTH transcriptional regulator
MIIAKRRTAIKRNIVPSGTISGTINGTIKSEENDSLILNAISTNPSITLDGLSTLLNMPRRTVSREMKKLQETGRIERDGTRKKGRWIIKQKYEQF